ncbi:MAG: hypothetical protein ACLTYN_10310 [Dysosmobacter welbionis]
MLQLRVVHGLYVQQAFGEYVKAWCAHKIMARSMVWAIPTVRVQHVRGL